MTGTAGFPPLFWDVAWRVGLLLGAGALAIVALNLLSAARRRKSEASGEGREKARRSLWPRFWVWVAGTVLLLLGAGLGKVAFGILLAALSIQAMREMTAAVAKCGISLPSEYFIGAAPLAIMPAAFFGPAGAYAGLAMAAVCLPMLVLWAGGESRDRGVVGIFAGAGAFFYVVFPLAVIVALLSRGDGFALVSWLLIVIVLSDTFAMFGGLAFGRRPLAPTLSAGKTVEGVIAGFCGALAGGALMQFAFPLAPSFAYYAATFCIALAGLAGDLVASSVKRAAGLDDFSAFLPGHGGLMDRLDSILFGAPVVYLFIFAGAFG